MSKICIVNGSPRKTSNTAQMCNAFIDGVKSVNSDIVIKLFNLYELDYKGCVSCLGCKVKDSPNYGKCIRKDGITDIISEISEADGLVLASPLYFMDITGEMKSFIERLLFPFLTYEKGFRAIPPKKLHTATIYTMNVREEGLNSAHLDTIEWYISHVFNKPERICAFNTCQVNNYKKYRMDVFNEEDKLNYKEQNWQKDLNNAVEAGKHMAQKI